MHPASTPDQKAKPAQLERGDIPKLSQSVPSPTNAGVKSVQSKD